MRWKHDHLHLMTVALVFTISLIFLFFMLLSQTSVKKIELVVNGESVTVETKQRSLEDLLEEKRITVSAHDYISAPIDGKLQHGDKVVIEHAVPVQLTADGKTETKYTVADTVGEALEQFNVTVGEHDKVFPAASEPISPNASIKVVRVQKVVEEQTEVIPFQTVTKKDANLLKGKEQVVIEGKEGLLSKKIERVYEDGVLVTENLLETTIMEESVNKVVAYGTKNPVVVLSASSPDIDQVTKGDVTFAYKQVLNNVTLTAYTAHAASTGKTSDHPQYGITYSGTKATEGRTIAVDPKVIPIGWWVYIEGIGLRRAEDTGSAIKGNKIDIYFESEEYAKKFGLKRGYKVYIIGKDKPQMH
jgi:uncharacterized protein YabE (DUF348 family)/3D (Asp-Asp-Asp) domain-containing protein